MLSADAFDETHFSSLHQRGNYARVPVLFRATLFSSLHGDSLSGARECARERDDTFPPLSLFPFPFIAGAFAAAAATAAAEHQHHLLFARSIYSVNYICLCCRYTAAVLPSVNCAFTFFPPFTFIYFYFFFLRSLPLFFFVCSLLPFSHIARNLVFRAVCDFA